MICVLTPITVLLSVSASARYFFLFLNIIPFLISIFVALLLTNATDKFLKS